MHRRTILGSLAAALAGLATIAHAQFGLPPRGPSSDAPVDPRTLFVWNVSSARATVAPGDTLWIAATLHIARDHHVYAERTTVVGSGPAGVAVGKAIADSPEVRYDKFEKRDVAQYFADPTYRVPVVATAAFAGKTVSVRLALRTQGCSELTCYFPQADERTVSIAVKGSQSRTIAPAAAPPSAEAAPPTALTAAPREAAPTTAQPSGPVDLATVLAERGIFLALGLMFAGGILTSFTPCVYPLIPLTVSFFGASRAAPLRGFLLSSVFVLGMAAMYSALGVTAAATGAVFGGIMTNPVVIGLIAAIFLAFAASMFGAFKIRLPYALQARLQSVGGVGFGGAFLAGLVAGIVAAPCTGPVLGAALAWVATTGDLTLGFLAMFVFALGMGLLFIAIGTFSARVVPRSGAWLERVESVFGVVMIAAALWFLKDIVPPLRDVIRPGTAALLASLALVVVGLVLGAIHLRFVSELDETGNPKPAPSVVERTRKALGILLVVAGIYGAAGSFLVAPETAGGIEYSSRPGPEWVTDLDAGLARARDEGKPVVIDAWATWCTACAELDARTYSDPEVRKRLDGFVAIKLDMTETTTPAVKALVRRYRIVGLPTVIVLDRAGNELADRRVMGFLPPAEFLERLDGADGEVSEEE